MATFQSLGIDKWLIEALNTISIKNPTEIQQNVIHEILAGKNVIAAAKTGSGKTAAFALPILKTLAQDPYGVYGLVLTPTRELAFQIAEQFRVLGNSINLKLSVIVGGLDMTAQAIELSKKPHIVIATPGRLADHIRNSHEAIYFKRIKYLVFDEADRLLNESFNEDLTTIMKTLPKQRQTLLFSATMTKEIEQIKFDSITPFVYSLREGYETVENCKQQYLFIPSTVRQAYLVYLLWNDFAGKSVFLFCSKPKTCEVLRLMFKHLDIRSTSLHSQMSQNERLSSLAKFKSGIVPILISTDVGSRGLDIPMVELVINYELPADPADYVHRIGRTARAGRKGTAISFITEKDIEIIQNIESVINKKLTEYETPENKVLELLNQVNMAQREAMMALMDSHFGEAQKIRKEKVKQARVEPNLSKKQTKLKIKK